MLIQNVIDEFYIVTCLFSCFQVTALSMFVSLTFLVEGGNLSKAEEPGRFVMVSVRVLVRRWPLENEPVVHILAFNEEVTEVEGKQVQQTDMYEVNIFMNKEFQKLRQSSYAVCQWVEQLRERLRQFWTESLPLFFLFMWVVVVGVVGSAVIVKVLDLLFPTCQHK
ncbi:GINM1 protein, partial [Polyodon spathula]|nr:GINM1 protein [Polyodon spathula]